MDSRVSPPVCSVGSCKFATILLMIRILSVEEWGQFSLLLSIALVIQYISDFGLSSILVKEFSADLDKETALRGKAQGLILLMGGLLLLLTAPISFGLKTFLYPDLNVAMAIAMASCGICLFLCAGYTAVIRAYEDMEWNAYGHILHKISLFLMVVLVQIDRHRNLGHCHRESALRAAAAWLLPKLCAQTLSPSPRAVGPPLTGSACSNSPYRSDPVSRSGRCPGRSTSSFWPC